MPLHFSRLYQVFRGIYGTKVLMDLLIQLKKGQIDMFKLYLSEEKLARFSKF